MLTQERKLNYQKSLQALEEDIKGLEDKIAALHNAGESSWESLKEGIDNAWEIIKMTLSKAKSEFERGYKEGKD